MRVAVIGLGLIGGSIALAARERLGASVAGYDRDPAALAAASRRGAVDSAAAGIEDAVAGASVAFVAVPVSSLAEVVRAALAAAPPECVVTDVGSTKRALLQTIDDQRFIGGHPLAGAETAGIEHARADLFDGATWYLTPGSATSGFRFQELHRVLSGLGARPVAIDARTHDELLAVVSHLPHVLANVLVAQAAGALADERLPATGPSFRDATRVAGSPTAVWADIYLSNAAPLAGAIEATIGRLQRVAALLRDGDREAIAAWNDRAAEDRRVLHGAQLGGGSLRELRVAVPNRPGVVAELALALGGAGVNIVDMALYPAPDMSEGVIALWLAGEPAAERARALIGGLGFPVYSA